MSTQPPPVDSPQKTAVVLVSPGHDVLRRLDALNRRAEPRLRRCKLWIVIHSTSPRGRAALDADIERACADLWPLRAAVLWPPSLELEEPSSAPEMKVSLRHRSLAHYLHYELIPKVIRAGGTNPVRLVWCATDADLAAAGTAAVAAHEDVSWIDPPGGTWEPIARKLVGSAATPQLRSAAKDAALLGESDGVRRVRRELSLLAPEDYPVLLVGRTGTGKDLCAKELHRLSARKGEFASFNGALLDPGRAGSELFGHKRGAFTGANSRHPGRISEAEKGTFFLDELDSTPYSSQSQLLRALNHVRDGIIDVQPIGGTSRDAKKVEARFVAAAHPDTLETIREDLRFRIAAFEIHLPQLADRGDDVLILAASMIQKMHDRRATGPRGLTKQAKTALREYHWPGNVRELETVILRGFLFASDAARESIDLRDLPETVRQRPAASSFSTDRHLQDRVAQYVVAACTFALASHPENKAAAARELGFTSGQALERYLKQHERQLGKQPRKRGSR